MCYTEDVVKILDHVNNHLRQISTYKIGNFSLDGMSIWRMWNLFKSCLMMSVLHCSHKVMNEILTWRRALLPPDCSAGGMIITLSEMPSFKWSVWKQNILEIMAAWQKVIRRTTISPPTGGWDESGEGRRDMRGGLMVKLRRSHSTILLRGTDQYGFMMRHQSSQDIKTDSHRKVSQKIWTHHRTEGRASLLQSVSNSTDLCFFFSFASRAVLTVSEPGLWPGCCTVKTWLCHHCKNGNLSASFSFKTILQISAQSLSTNGQAVSKHTNQSRWRLKSESLAVRFLNIN